MQNSPIVYRNILLFLVLIVLLNIAIGFYSNFKKGKKNNGSAINYVVNSKESVKDLTSVDYISQANEMMEVFKKYDFTIDDFLSNDSVNLIIFSSLPEDFMDIEPVSERKKLFINTLLPIIFLENSRILEDRKKILDWWNESQGENFSRDFWPSWLFELSEKYDSDDSNLGNLLVKVDIIPISMVLAQAAIESGWGTSRYLREGNAIFGQYTFDKKKGLKPINRDKDKKFFIRKFSNLSESTRSYLKNLNTNLAYKEFREERKKLRMGGEILSGLKLSSFMTRYSERKNDYVNDLKKIIESNNFMKFDNKNSMN